MKVSYDTKVGSFTLYVDVALNPEAEPAVKEYLDKVAETFRAKYEEQMGQALKDLMFTGVCTFRMGGTE